MRKKTKSRQAEDDNFVLNLFITFAMMYLGIIVLAS